MLKRIKKFVSKSPYSLILIGGVLIVVGNVYVYRSRLQALHENLTAYREITHSIRVIPTVTRTLPDIDTETAPSFESGTKVASPQEDVAPTVPPEPTKPWGVAEKVDDVTYTIKVGHDATMASPQEVYEAINLYRNTAGIHSLTWDDTLAQFAQSRADTFTRNGGTDKHAGFNAFLQNEDGFNKLGFQRVGENSYFGGPLTGTHVIEWVFAKSPGHNANQLNTVWTEVGVGVTENAINIIFAADRL